ncbi:hypothetical protein [Streptacidiphilus sp. MAP5-3]|uniref:hypothetical protein n=1 Tax=unclassified Streptacidiphilus TaxID=2643834 RepID=UPI003515A08A
MSPVAAKRTAKPRNFTSFPELDSFVVPHQTVLYGPVTDEAHLYGLLVRFQNLGLRVVEMRQLPERSRPFRFLALASR